MSTYTIETIIRGYHVYQVVWEAAVGQVLPCQQERGNVHMLNGQSRDDTLSTHAPKSACCVLRATPLPCLPTPQKITEKTFVALLKSAKSGANEPAEGAFGGLHAFLAKFTNVFSLESFPLYGIQKCRVSNETTPRRWTGPGPFALPLSSMLPGRAGCFLATWTQDGI